MLVIRPRNVILKEINRSDDGGETRRQALMKMHENLCGVFMFGLDDVTQVNNSQVEHLLVRRHGCRL